MTKEEIKQFYKTDRKKYWQLRAQLKFQNDPEYLKKYYARNKEKLQEKFKQYYHENKARLAGRGNVYYRLHPEKLASAARRAYAKRKGAIGSHTAKDWETIKEIYGYACCKCFVKECDKVSLTVDHKIPLSKGGTNFPDNLQPMCMPCNRKKGTVIWFASCPLTLG